MSFGVVVPGSAVRTDAVQVAEGRWVLDLGYAPAALTVFLTAPVPDGAGVGVYLTAETDPSNYAFVGSLTNASPSAILETPAAFLSATAPVRVQLGFSLEPLDVLANLGPPGAQAAAQSTAATKMSMAGALLTSLYEMLGSYARTVTPASPVIQLGAVESNTEYIVMPMQFVDAWEKKVRRMIQNGTFS